MAKLSQEEIIKGHESGKFCAVFEGFLTQFLKDSRGWDFNQIEEFTNSEGFDNWVKYQMHGELTALGSEIYCENINDGKDFTLPVEEVEAILEAILEDGY